MSNSQLTVLNDAIQSTQTNFVNVRAVNSMSFEREAEFAMQALTNNTFLATQAMNNRQSLIDAVTNVAAIGISLNPAEKQAYLVPRKGRVCLDISYMGLIDLATSSGSIEWAKAELVYRNDDFRLNDIDKMPSHRRDPFSNDRGDVVGAYVVAKLPNGDYLTDVMSKDELDGIKSRSETFKKGSGPWVTDEGEMQKKTVIKRASKTWPKNTRLAQAIDVLNNENGEGIEEMRQKELSKERMDQLISEVAQAETLDQLSVVWSRGSAEIGAIKNRYQFEKFKGAALEKREFLSSQTVDVEATVVNGEENAGL